MKNIAITLRIEYLPTRNEWRDSIDQRLGLWISMMGYKFIYVPNNIFPNSDSVDSNKLIEWIKNFNVGGFVLSGGNDVGEFSDRDKTESLILDICSMDKLPVLGICRGMQIMGLWAGTSLVKVENHICNKHSLNHTTEDRNFPKNVNSFHNFSLLQCPEGFDITSLSNDRSIESIKHKTLPWEGWMWHPERERKFLETDLIRAQKLLLDKG